MKEFMNSGAIRMLPPELQTKALIRTRRSRISEKT